MVETGVAYHGHKVQYADAPKTKENNTEASVGSRTARCKVVKFGDRYISASRDVTEVVLAEEASRSAAVLAEAEHAAMGLLQAAALPSSMPELAGVRIAAVYEPADPRQPVGGDWYDVCTVDDNRVALVIADVAGHGTAQQCSWCRCATSSEPFAAEHADPHVVLTRANDITTRLNEPDGPRDVGNRCATR